MDPLPISYVPIVSVDLETGGLIPGKHTPLSIGAIKLNADHSEINENNSFYVQLEWDAYFVTPQAMRINGLDIVAPPGKDGMFDDKSLPAIEGVKSFVSWLGKPQIYAMGANVGSFDLQMLKAMWNKDLFGQWPFHYRSIDLNSLFFALSDLQNIPFDVIKKEIQEKAWSDVEELRSSSSATILNAAFDETEHHALYDAWSNIFAWKECIRRFDGHMVIQC